MERCFYAANGCCRVCGCDKRTNVIDVHHIDNNHNNDNPANLVVLCRSHHRKAHTQGGFYNIFYNYEKRKLDREFEAFEKEYGFKIPR